MNIHLSKPGGQREGPFTLEQINQDLAAQKYHDSDYWAWYEGLNEWVPLHQVPGVIRSAASEPQEIPGLEPTNKRGDTEVILPPSEQASAEEPEEVTAQDEAPPQEETASPDDSVTDEESGSQRETVRQDETASQEETPISGEEAVPQEVSSFQEETALEPGAAQHEEPTFEEEQVPQEEAVPEESSAQTEEPAQPLKVPPSLANQLFSGMPFEALEQVILLSSADAQNASRSAITTGMLEAAIGTELDVIREKVPRDAMGGCVFLEKLREGGRIPDAALRAAAKLKSDLVRQAREGLYRICVRTFPIESGEMVALFLFYNKQKL